MEIRIFELPLRTVERLVRLAPRVIRRVTATLGGCHGNPSRNWTPGSVHNAHVECSHYALVTPLRRLNTQFLGSRDFHHPERRIAAFIGDERDAAAIARPARCGCVELAVSKGQGITALARHQPQLNPLPAELGAVDDA